MDKPLCWDALTQDERKDFESRMEANASHERQLAYVQRNYEFEQSERQRYQAAWHRLKKLLYEEVGDLNKRLRAEQMAYQEAIEAVEEAYLWLKDNGHWKEFCLETGVPADKITA